MYVTQMVQALRCIFDQPGKTDRPGRNGCFTFCAAGLQILCDLFNWNDSGSNYRITVGDIMLKWLEEFIKTLPEGTYIAGIDVSCNDDHLYYDNDTHWICSM
jgi:hypothetical protein